MASPYHPLGKALEQAAGPGGQASKKRKGETKDSVELSYGEVPSSPLRHEYKEQDFYSTERLEGYNRRQRYLRSYTFSRKKSATQKVQDSLRKLKSAAWAVVACNYKPTVAMKIREQFHQHSSKIFSSAPSVKFRMPSCFRMPQIS